METDTPGPVPIAIGIGPGIPAAAAGQSAVATGSIVRPAASAGTPSSEDEREIYVPAPQGHGFTGSTQGAEETDHAWHMGRRIPMVRPGLRIQGLIEVPGPALISITTLTEGVVEGVTTGPSTHDLHHLHGPGLHGPRESHGIAALPMAPS